MIFQQMNDMTAFQRSKPFAKANILISAWQVMSTLTLLSLLIIATTLIHSWFLKLLLVIPIAGIFVRLFVLQHDCGHGSFFNSPNMNNLCGLILSFITTVPFRLWATEHRWHHGNQGKLERRGIDMMNSPMTLEEAQNYPERRDFMIAKVTPLNVFLIGAKSLMWDRKFVRDFFMFRPDFRWPVAKRKVLERSIYTAHFGSLIVHSVILWNIGLLNWLVILLPAAFIAAGLGSLLFWVQHNFEHSYHAHEQDWKFENVGLHGSSYLRLSRLFNWFTASIGLHHVHHLNARIPNYRLEQARQSITELRNIQPLSKQQLKDSFEKLFWDSENQKMCAWRKTDNSD